MQVYVFVPSLFDQDAVGRDVIGMARALCAAGYPAKVICQESSSVEYRARHYRDVLNELDSKDDLLIYHHCTYAPVAKSIAASFHGRKILRYHNVTPPEFLDDINPASADLARAGRCQTAELVAAGFDQYWPTSNYTQTDLIESGGAAAELCRVLSPLHDVERLLAQPIDQQLVHELSDGKINLLNVGRLVPNKNHLALVRALHRLRELGVGDSRLIFIGKSDPGLAAWPRRIRRLVNELKLNDAVQFAGCVDDCRMSSYFRTAHVYVSASRHEGFCIPVIEAMAHGVPVVALDAAAVGETVGDAGMLVNSDEPIEMADAIFKVLTSADLQKALLQRGRRRYQQRFSQPVLEERLLSLVADILPTAELDSSSDGCILPVAELAKSSDVRFVASEVSATSATAGDNSSAARLSPDNAVIQAESFMRSIPPGGEHLQGRGIIICAGGVRYNTCAWVLVNVLRRLGCELPIQIWYCGKAERDDAWIRLVEPLGVDCVDAESMGYAQASEAFRGWALKPFALLHSRFAEVLLLDADVVPVQDPSFLFDSRPYQERGAVFWPDDRRTPRDSLAWQVFGVTYRDEAEQESGQVLVDKRRHWRAVNLDNWYNEHAKFFYRFVYGDKDTFRFAWHRLEHSFNMPSTPPRKLSRALIQHDFHGQPLFQHRCLDKWSWGGNCRIPGFIHEPLCFDLIDDLQRRWRPRFIGNRAHDSAVEEKVSGKWFIYSRVGSLHWPLKLEPSGLVQDGHSSGHAFWWSEDHQLVLANANGDVTCRFQPTNNNAWQGIEARHPHQRAQLFAAKSHSAQ